MQGKCFAYKDSQEVEEAAKRYYAVSSLRAFQSLTL